MRHGHLIGSDVLLRTIPSESKLYNIDILCGYYRAFCKVWTDCIHRQTGGEYLRIRTQAATREYASNVPMDMRSTRSFRSNRKAIIAANTRAQFTVCSQEDIIISIILEDYHTAHSLHD